MLLPEHIRTVHVAEVENKINIGGEVTSRQGFQVYRPGLERQLRNAVMERIIFDGHLKISPQDKADSVLKLELLEFRRDPLRYNQDDTIAEYRVHVVASASFTDRRENKSIWSTSSISGNKDFHLAGELAISEDEAVELALEDLSRHVVESILEIW